MKNERRLEPSAIARFFGVTPTTIRNWIRSGRCVAETTPTGRYRVPESELRRLLKKKSEKYEKRAVAR